MRSRLLLPAVMVFVAAGCSQTEEVPAMEQARTSAPQAAQTPERVRGCLMAGDTDTMFVLTARAEDTKMQATTYRLVGQADALRAHVGKQVEVGGTVVTEQTAEALGPRMPATKNDRPTGTSGPTVQSSTEIVVKHLQVSSVTPVADKCDDR